MRKISIVIAAVAFALMAGTGAAEAQYSSTKDRAAKAKSETMAKMDIVETAVAAGSFNTLVTAIKTAGLVDALMGEGPFTVFAPTDDAFAKLPAGTIDALLQDKEKLTKILTYHVVSGKVLAKDVVKLSEAETLQGGKVKIDATKGVKVNDASVVKADIMTSNGVIHVIDTVLLPESGKH